METQKPSQEKNKEFNIDLKSLEVPIEKYPMAESKNMFESFLIIGYDDLYYQEKILKLIMKIDFNSIEAKDKKLREEIQYYKVHCRNLPTILSSITSDFSGPILNGNQIIEDIFPIPPAILIEIGNKENENKENKKKDIKKDNKNKESENEETFQEKNDYFVIFSNIQNEVVNYGFGYIFYSEKKNYESYKIYLPKAFVIISQYPFFNIFNKLCEEIKELFINNQQLQIPIEIQIYNIINFVPAPIDTGLKMTLIPKLELSRIDALKDQDEFFLQEKQQKYYPAQLNGYRSTEINFCYLLNILPVETIFEIYLNLICGRIIGFFGENITELSIIIHIFNQFLFPFAPNENVSCLSPIKFFCNETVDQNIVGFVCNYEDLEKYDPFREIEKGEFRCLTDEEENIDLDPLYFKCDYILDLKTCIFKEPDKYVPSEEDNNNKEERKILNEFIKKIIGKISKKKNESDFAFIYKLFNDLKDLLLKLTSSKKIKNAITNPFLPDDIKYTNRSFLQFNLNLAHLYYQKVSGYNGDYNISKEDQVNKPLKTEDKSGLNKEEYVFLKSFGNSLYGNCLDNFVGGYSSREPKIYQASKLIFENLLYNLKIKKNNKSEEEKITDILVIYDEIYSNKKYNYENKNLVNNQKNSEQPLKFMEENKIEDDAIRNINYRTLTFFEFYKHYLSSKDIEQYFYNIANPEYVSVKIDKKAHKYKYYFNYKKIALDQNIILKYFHKLKRMDEETRRKCFKDIIQTKIIEKEPIKSYDNFISSALEKYYIKQKSIDNIELINFSILGILILTVSKHSLLGYTKAIDQIISNLFFLTRKFVKIILSICLRIFAKEKNKNINIFKQYFNLYESAIVKKNIFPTDEFKLLLSKINEFMNQEKMKSGVAEIKEKKDEEKTKYELKYNEKTIKKINFFEVIEKSEFEENNKRKINIHFKLNKKKLEYPYVYSIPEIYEKICSYIDVYYKDLDYNIIIKEKDEFNKIIIYLLFYIKISTEMKEDKNDKKNKDKKNKDKKIIDKYYGSFPEDIKEFLVNCLEI